MKLRIYQAVVVLVATLVLVTLMLNFRVEHWQEVLFLGLLALVAESLAVELAPVGSVSLSYAIIFSAIVYGGPVEGALVAAIGSISLREISENKPIDRMAFNTGQYILFASAAGLAQWTLSISPIASNTDGALGAYWLLGSLVVGLVMAIANMVLVGTAIALYSHSSLALVWRGSFRSYTVNLVALALLGLVLAQLLDIAGIPGTLLIVIPFALARQTFQVYSQQKEAYRETVRSMVTTLEAKDPYTRGHSERVAFYARRIAESLSLSDLEVQRIEWAALLHDIGKIAIPTETLIKPSRLTDEEYVTIRAHPELAASILAEIELLAEVAPYVAMHHERLDGRGYPLGLEGTDIPLGAKILATADCFDAMTSNRAYRDALSFEAASIEIRKSCDGQLDAETVAVLLGVIDEVTVRRLLDGWDIDYA